MSRKGVIPSTWVSPFYLFFTFLMVVMIAIFTIYQYYTPGIETVLGGAVGCTAGAYLTGKWGCAVGAGFGATTASFLFGGAADISYHIEGATDVRATGSLSNQLMAYQSPGKAPLEERIRRNLYCRSADTPPDYCGSYRDVPEAVQRIADAVISGDRRYTLEIRYAGEAKISASSQSTTFRQGPAIYTMPIAMPGGETASMKLLVEGTRGGVALE